MGRFRLDRRTMLKGLLGGVAVSIGLPPLEALACGCVLFSSFNHALADSLSPGVTAHQIGQGSLENDLARVSEAVASPQQWRPDPLMIEALLEEYSESRWCERWSGRGHRLRLRRGDLRLSLRLGRGDR